MIWTILILAVALILFVFVGKLVKIDGKKSSPARHLAYKVVKLVSLVLLIVGVNRLGIGTSYYLTQSNPAILQEMATNMQNQERERINKTVRSYVSEHTDEMAKLAPVLGNEKASKTIFVWTAADCPFCRRVHNELTRVLKEDKDVRVVIKNFPVHGDISDIPGRWTIAAKLQSNAKAAALYEHIMDKEYWGADPRAKDLNKVIAKNMIKYAKAVGLDVDRLEKDLNGPEVSQELMQVRELAQQFNITGTPFLIIGDQVFPGAIPYAQIMEALK